MKRHIPIYILRKVLRLLPPISGPELHCRIEYDTPEGTAFLQFKKIITYPGVKVWALQFDR